MNEHAGETQQLSLKEAHALLASVRFAALSPVLRDPDFAMVTALAFAGFRVDANGYANALVRRRLADEASRNALFAERLRQIAAQVSSPAPAPAARRTGDPPQPMPSQAGDERGDERAAQAYRLERDRLRREKSEEADRRRSAESELAQARMDALAADVGRKDAVRELERARQRAERLERKLRRAEVTNSELRKAIAVSTAAAPPDHRNKEFETRSAPAAEEAPRTSEDFVDAVRRLAEKSNGAAARQVASEVLRKAPENEDALEILAATSLKAGEAQTALSSLRTLAALQGRAGRFADALETLARLVGIAPDPKAVREFLGSLSQSNVDLEEFRQSFDQLRARLPDAYRAFRDQAQGELGTVLFAPRHRPFGPDEALPLGAPPAAGRAVTARQVLSWIDRGDVDRIEALRQAISAAGEADRTAISSALTSAADGDSTYFRLLARPTLARAALVDASNVAWHGQDMLASPRPRLAHILAVRRALRARGHFPVLVIGDANLPHVIDDPAAVRKMIDSGELSLVTGGTDADEYLLREARRLNAYIVSNDYMADWDPEQQTPKLQFAIAHTGVATIYE